MVSGNTLNCLIPNKKPYNMSNTKRYLFFDCETTGLINFKLPIEYTPRIVQLAALLTDENGLEYGSMNHIVKPSGYTIPYEAAKIHGITNEIALEKGIGIVEVVNVFRQLFDLADVMIAYNYAYDSRIIAAEAWRLGIMLQEKEQFCIMLAMTKICKIPHAKWKNRMKWPKLQEAYEWCFGKKFDKAHDALADVRACRDVYFHSCHTQRSNGETLITLPLKHHMEGKPVPNLTPFEVVEETIVHHLDTPYSGDGKAGII